MFLSEEEKNDRDHFGFLWFPTGIERNWKISAQFPFIFCTFALINESLFFQVYSYPVQMG